MASKSKKRRRVLGASCILAALIIAGSSFAWFTSKDEVTNRLTANADYGVSIVESFAPPANWLPGQQVNKDVYAVNTGNIAAFVNEDVSSVLNYTYEDTVSALTGDCVVLNETTKNAIDGATTYEAGGFLAWTDATATTTTYKAGDKEIAKSTIATGTFTASKNSTSKDFGFKYTDPDTGNVYYGEAEAGDYYKVTAGTPDTYDDAEKVTISKTSTTGPAIDPGAVNSQIGQGNGWTPTEQGAYIFRRKINNATPDTYTYAGYYFAPKGATVGGQTLTEDTYYKIVIGNDNYSTKTGVDTESGTVNVVFDIYADQDNVKTLGATIDENGAITGKVDYRFVEEKSTGDVTPTLKYESKAASGKAYDRLVAEYTLGKSAGTGPYDASANAARKEVDYQNAQKYSDLADELYGYAKADVDYATTLATERNKLIDAAIAAHNASDAEDAKKTLKDNEWDDVFGTNQAYDQFVSAYSALITTTGDDNDLTELNPTNFVPSQVRTAATTNGADHPYVKKNYDELVTLYSKITACKGAIDTAKSVLDGYKANTDKDTDPALIQAQIDAILENLELLEGYLDEYKLKYADLVNSVAASTDATLNIETTTLTAKKVSIDGVIALFDATDAAADTLNDEESDYAAAYKAWDDAKKAASTASDDWDTAVSEYNANVGAAQTKYTTAIGTATHGQNHAAALVNKTTGYSATDRAAGGTDPTIQAASPDYEEYYALAKIDPDGDGKDEEVGDEIADALDIELTWTSTANADGTANDYTQTNHDETKKLSQWEEFKNGKNTAVANAKKDYADAVKELDEGSTVKIYINLDKDYDQYWDYDERTDNTTTASFYYKKILEAGVTSEKLIDSVELADTVTAGDYKNLTFDLNVALDSAQVAYDDDQRTYNASAVQSPAFGMKVDSITDNTDVAWTEGTTSSTPATVSYKVGAADVTPTAITPTTANDGKSYTWEIDVSGTKYWGTSKLDGATYVKVTDASAATPTVDTTDTVTLNVSRT